MVHFSIRSKKEKEPPLEASPLVLESLAQLHADNRSSSCAADDSICNKESMSTARTASIRSMDSMDEVDAFQRDLLFDVDGSDDLSFDGDEPRIFFELLCQTGSEMMQVCTPAYLGSSCKCVYAFRSVLTCSAVLLYKQSRRSIEHLVREHLEERPQRIST
jgi:hypothetical protein